MDLEVGIVDRGGNAGKSKDGPSFHGEMCG
jgi:hypothetical protein